MGVSGAGFMITVHPASNAGATLLDMIAYGTFHGAMAATTPTGSRTTKAQGDIALLTRSSNAKRVRTASAPRTSPADC